MDAIQEEVWKPIPGYERYHVSNLGNVRTSAPRNRNDKSVKIRPIKLVRINEKVGYLKFSARNNEGKKNYLVHRAVLESFVGPCPQGFEACHNDGNKENNRLENLRWDSRRNNTLDQFKHGVHLWCGRVGTKTTSVKLTDNDVIQIKKLLSDSASTYEIAHKFGVAQPTIFAIKVGRTWKHI